MIIVTKILQNCSFASKFSSYVKEFHDDIACTHAYVYTYVLMIYIVKWTLISKLKFSKRFCINGATCMETNYYTCYIIDSLYRYTKSVNQNALTFRVHAYDIIISHIFVTVIYCVRFEKGCIYVVFVDLISKLEKHYQ